MKAVVNGQPVELEGSKLTSVFSELGLKDLRGVAVAVDEEIVPRSSWEAFELNEGTRVEVLHAVQGG